MYAAAYRIAEEAHKGCDNSYIWELCEEAAREHSTTAAAMYQASRNVYNREFAR